MTVARIIELARNTAALLKTASYRENAYQSVLGHLLEDEYDVQMEVGVVYRLPDTFVFGHGRMDMKLYNKKTGACFILELKANVQCRLQQHMGQLSRYLVHSPDKATGILIYFSGWDADVHHYVLSCRK